ncbi:glutamate decarboxylase [Planctomyces bekefii]|uniref:Glutamate decarboxylase n=1 Tax=Planctomyces bekefii TaxID=1653850 RepID=A0A5C6MGL3_9PLAN|nr:glutamate decarboxylase [Planctomyces bekefii]
MTNQRIPKRAEATLETMRKVFTLPEGDGSTLARLEREISENLLGFLRNHFASGDIAPANLEVDFKTSTIPEDPVFVSEQVDYLLSKVVSQSVHTASPSFIGHMTSAMPYFMVPLAKIMIPLNQNVVKIETSKAFTPLERQVIGMLHRLIYGGSDAFYDQWTQSSQHSLGVFCSGGTIANITGLWVARNRLLGPRGDFPGVADEGLGPALRHYGYDGLAVLVSKRGHYSLSKAANLLGLGRKELIAVPLSSSHKIDTKALRRELDQLKKRRIAPIAIVGIAGTTETGNVNPLDELANIAQDYQTAFHVDAAWGGPTLFSERYKGLLKGIERADSVVIDAHKQLYVPIGAGMVLFKNVEALSAVEHHANYIIRPGSRDIGKHTLEGSRPGMAMLVHSALRIIGRRGYEILIDLGIGKAGQFAKMIKASPCFEVITEPELNLLTYRYVPESVKAALMTATPETQIAINDVLSALTESIQKTQRQRGKTFVSRTRLEAQAYASQTVSVFRVVLANPLTTRQILSDILEEQRQDGEKLYVEEGMKATIEEILKTAARK